MVTRHPAPDEVDLDGPMAIETYPLSSWVGTEKNQELLVAKRQHRIQIHGAPRRHGASPKPNSGEKQGRDCKRERIGGVDADQENRHPARQHTG